MGADLAAEDWHDTLVKRSARGRIRGERQLNPRIPDPKRESNLVKTHSPAKRKQNKKTKTQNKHKGETTNNDGEG